MGDKKPEEKKPEETTTVTLTIVEIHDQIVKLVNDNLTPGSTSKFDVRYINPNDKTILDVNISPRNFKRKTAEEVDELISEQVIKQMVSFGLNITKDDIAKAKLEPKKPDEKKPEEKKPEEKKPEEKKPAEKKPEDKKPEEKKPEETTTVTLTIVEIHDQIVKLVNDNLTPGSTSKFDVRYINPNDKTILDVNISPRNFKRKTAEEIEELISEQVIKQ